MASLKHGQHRMAHSPALFPGKINTAVTIEHCNQLEKNSTMPTHWLFEPKVGQPVMPVNFYRGNYFNQ